MTSYPVIRVNAGVSVFGTRAPLASLTCAVDGQATVVELRTVPRNVEDADHWVSNRAAFYRIGQGDCATSQRGQGRWQLSGEDAGALACTVEDGTAILIWSKTDDDFVGIARRTDGDAAALRDWWNANNIFISP